MDPVITPVVWRFFDPEPTGPYIADILTFDIPETIAACIRNAKPGLVAVRLSRRGGARMVEAATVAARDRGVAIEWTEPEGADLTY